MEGGIANGFNWFPSHAKILEWVLTPKFIYNLLHILKVPKIITSAECD